MKFTEFKEHQIKIINKLHSLGFVDFDYQDNHRGNKFMYESKDTQITAITPGYPSMFVYLILSTYKGFTYEEVFLIDNIEEGLEKLKQNKLNLI